MEPTIVTPFQFRGLRILFGLALLSIVALFGALAQKNYRQSQFVGKPENVRDTITMSGRGQVTAIPDIALVDAGLEISAPTVSEAQRKNTDAMNGFLADVKTLGVDQKDRKTTAYTIEPKYEEHFKPTGVFERRVLVGYTVRQNVQLKVRALGKVGDVIAAAGKWGLNQVNDFSFSVDNQDGLKQEALEKAIIDARAKAESLVRVGGAHIGRLVSFSEGGGPMPYTMMAAPMMEMKGGAAPVPAPILEQGSQDIVVTVSVTYELLP